MSCPIKFCEGDTYLVGSFHSNGKREGDIWACDTCRLVFMIDLEDRKRLVSGVHCQACDSHRRVLYPLPEDGQSITSLHHITCPEHGVLADAKATVPSGYMLVDRT